jgi:WYL domain-containing protein
MALKLTKNWYQEARLKALETLLYWRGRLNTTDLVKLFGVSRISAQSDIHRYIKHAPGNIVYKPKERFYVATSIFKNYLTEGSMDEFMQFEPDVAEYVQKPQFHINPELARPLIQAIHDSNGVSILYSSMNHPEGLERAIFPHTLVYSGFRWHVRAWCCLRNDFRDFNLSRMLKVSPLKETVPEESKKENDELWNEMVDIKLMANPSLNEQERFLIEMEFGMKRKQLKITTRAALVMYTLQAYQVDINLDKNEIYKQRLVLVDQEALSPYLF